MTLDFMLLIVDDSPDDVRQALAGLRDHLEARGFSLKRDVQSTDFSDATLSALASAAGRDYDLVMVDYRLGQPDRDGAVVARRLRAKLPYTEMVFYSSDPAAQLLNELAQNEVAGVFVARRQDLNDALTGLADTVIRKTVDLNHMRGIAMAAVAEMDALMEEALGRALQSGDALPREQAQRSIAKLSVSLQRDAGRLQAALEAQDILSVVNDGRLFSFAHKYHLVRGISKRLPNRPTVLLNELKPFATSITDRRNLLAHVKAATTEDGSLVLQSVKPGEADIVIDDSWMEQLRRDLTKYKPALRNLCEFLDLQLANVHAQPEP